MKLTGHHFSHQFLILLAACGAAGGSLAQGPPPRSEGQAIERQPEAPPVDSAAGSELPFRLSEGYLILVEGAIGSRTHLRFLLDTGASMSIVDSKIADGMKLHREPAESFNFDRNLAWDQASIPEVRFGPITAVDTVMLVGPLAKYSEFACNVDAIIGLDLLRQRNFTVDYAVKKIIFHPAASGPPRFRDEPLASSLTLLIQIQGHPVRLIVDTGFPGILLFEERLFGRVPELKTARDVSRVRLGERLHTKAATLRGVAIGSNSGDASVLLAKAPPPEILPGIDGVAGIAALKARRVHFNFAETTLSWD